MAFTLRDLVAKLPPLLEQPCYTCPTNKQAYATKIAARKALRVIRRRDRTTMRIFRCGYCDHYHFGHRRGQIL